MILGRPPASSSGEISRAAIALWREQGKWADIGLQGVSMEPIIRDGSTLRVRFGHFGPGDLAAGDVVVYRPAQRLVAHRITRTGRGARRAGWIEVKGDPLGSRRASWIPASDVLGRVAAVRQPDGQRLYLDSPVGRMLGRAAAVVSRHLGMIDARLPGASTRHPSLSLSGRGLGCLAALHGKLHAHLERDWGLLLTPEAKFLVAACRPRLEESRLPEVERASREVTDWDAVRESAASLGLAPVLHRNLGDGRLDGGVPAQVRARVSRDSHLAAYIGLQQRGELARILDALGRRGIEPILLKGAALSLTVYGDPALRTMQDLDILVEEDRLAEASAAIESLDYAPLYRPQLADPRRRAAFYGRHHHETPLRSARGHTVVELHRHIASFGAGESYDVREIRRRARTVRIDGRPVRVPCPEDLILNTCLHMSLADRFVGKLRDLMDLHQIVEVHSGDIDWQALLAGIPSGAVARCLHSCLDLARRLYGTEVPEDFLHEVRKASGLGWVGTRLVRVLACSVLFQPAKGGSNVLSTASLRWCCDAMLRRDGWGARLRALAALMATG